MGAPVASKMLPEKENCTQDFLNAGQYARNGILRYERVFGRTFVSTGGLTTTKDIVDPIGLKPGMKVLDIGCGTGGSAFYMASYFGAEVLGIDLSDNMLAVANEHKATMQENVQHLVSFRFLDATQAAFPENYFDVIYSRDAIMHIADKELVYSKALSWLKPGGQLVVSEYVHGRNHPNLLLNMLNTSRIGATNWSQFKNMEMCSKRLALRGYKLLTKPPSSSLF